MMIWIGVLIVVIALFVEVFYLTDTNYFLVGGIIPLLGTIGMIAMVVMSGNYSGGQLFLVLLVIFVLLVFWGIGDNRHRKKVKRAEAERLAHDAKDE